VAGKAKKETEKEIGGSVISKGTYLSHAKKIKIWKNKKSNRKKRRVRRYMDWKCIIWGTPLPDYQSVYDPDLGHNYVALQRFEHKPFFKENREQGKYKIYNPRAGGQYFISYTQMKITETNERYTIKDHSTGETRPLTEKEQIQLSGYIAQENLRGHIPDLDEMQEDSNWLEKLPKIPSPNKQANLLLTGLGRIYPKIGGSIKLDNSKLFLSSLSYSTNEQEFQFLINDLMRFKYIESSPCGLKGFIQISMAGWKHFEKINEIKNKNSEKTFIAMWITDAKSTYHREMQILHQNIEQAIEQTGYRPIRIDKKRTQ